MCQRWGYCETTISLCATYGIYWFYFSFNKVFIYSIKIKIFKFHDGGSGKRFHKFLAEDYCYKTTTVNNYFDLLGHKFSHTGSN